VSGVGFVHTTTVHLPSHTKRSSSKAGFGLKKYPDRFNHPICADAGDFIAEMLDQLETTTSSLSDLAKPSSRSWPNSC
jgi:hypothetical protein